MQRERTENIPSERLRASLASAVKSPATGAMVAVLSSEREGEGESRCYERGSSMGVSLR